ncbi:GNAT family N-acetyltransferase [Clostridium sp. MSJ-4]|uniref:GNAT family N-acetyltransferase n=1 Tax=Clostridium simiarum TaxID=2841506 RepID=A0ABS6EX50_9CLOT|nr:GNAT family N-acetyltransferase [Clostridium simiarum]MBU5590229.1 GNAT family N-acetyltransferase [Clostridium simiarum]
MIRKLEINDDLEKVSRLIYDTDVGIFEMLFGERDKAISIIRKLIERENNSFSYKHIFCYIDEEIRGILIGYNYKDIDESEETAELNEILPKGVMLELFFKSLILKPVIEKKEVNDLYIQNICVEESYRGRSIGTKLIDYYFEYAKNLNHQAVFLDVSYDNYRAKKLYEEKGFLTISSKKIRFSNEGVYRMRTAL